MAFGRPGAALASPTCVFDQFGKRVMRILHVITTMSRGGAENHVVDLAVGQAGRGADVAVAYLKGDGYWADRLRTSGVRVEPLGLRRYGAIAPFFALRRLLRDYAPDLIHAHLPPAELYTTAALLPTGSGPPLVITKHNDEPFYPGPGHDVVGRWVMRRASRAIAISNAVNLYTRERLHLSDDKLRTVYYGIDCDPFETIDAGARQALHAEWGINEGEIVIGTVARMVPQKALHVLLSAFARYRSISQRSPRLVIVGRGPLMAELNFLAQAIGLSDSIVWTGFREDIPAVMHAFDVFSLTSAYEGFGLVLLEAMAASRPVIATAVSAIPEIVQDGRTGVLCPANNAGEIAAAFLRLEDANVRAVFGSNGRLRVRENFTLDRVADATMAVYRECIA
jgi:glycosyltransferase involved in cell wall biosynthesis